MFINIWTLSVDEFITFLNNIKGSCNVLHSTKNFYHKTLQKVIMNLTFVYETYFTTQCLRVTATNLITE